MPKGLTVELNKTSLVIRVPIGVLRMGAPHAWDQAWGEHQFFVSDQLIFAGEVRAELEREEEDGTTLVHRMLDKAMVEAAEQGGEGIAERKRAVRG